MATALLVLGSVLVIAEWIYSALTRDKANDLSEEQQS